MEDYLGNIRVVANAGGAVVQKNAYYPFGMAFAGSPGGAAGGAGASAADQAKQPYKFGGKELDQAFGLDQYDFSARYYDPATARFTSQDPLAEKYYSISPYAYCSNNPIKYIDPSGMNPDWFYNQTSGNIHYNETYTQDYTKSLGTDWVHMGANNMFNVSDQDLLARFGVKSSSTTKDGDFSREIYIGASLSINESAVGDFLSAVNYICVPAQEFKYTESYINYVPNGPYSMRTENGSITTIVEKINYVPTNSQRITEKIESTINTQTGVGGFLKTFMFGQSSYYTRSSFEYKGSSTPYQAPRVNRHDGYGREVYNSWDSYSRNTGYKGKLLKYK